MFNPGGGPPVNPNPAASPPPPGAPAAAAPPPMMGGAAAAAGGGGGAPPPMMGGGAAAPPPMMGGGGAPPVGAAPTGGAPPTMFTPAAPMFGGGAAAPVAAAPPVAAPGPPPTAAAPPAGGPPVFGAGPANPGTPPAANPGVPVAAAPPPPVSGGGTGGPPVFGGNQPPPTGGNPPLPTGGNPPSLSGNGALPGSTMPQFAGASPVGMFTPGGTGGFNPGMGFNPGPMGGGGAGTSSGAGTSAAGNTGGGVVVTGPPPTGPTVTAPPPTGGAPTSGGIQATGSGMRGVAPVVNQSAVGPGPPPMFRFSATAAASDPIPRPSYPTADVLPEPDVVMDRYAAGNAHPKFMRMSINAVPTSPSLLKTTQLVFGCTMQAYGEAPVNEDPVPVVKFGSYGIVRCRRCRTYINPFVPFVDGGRRWRCNVCFLLNDVPSDYYSPIDASTGRRRDLAQRPELTSGSVEYIAPSEYMVRPPQPPVFLFVIDVSYNAVASGMVETLANTVADCLDDLPGGSRTRVGFITVDTAVHFYSLNSSLTVPQMHVVSDVDDIFLPVPRDLVVNLADSREVVNALLEGLPTMFASTQQTGSALGAAIQSAIELVEPTGGKVMVFQTTMPSVGPGRLKNREDPAVLGTDKEVKLLDPADNFYRGIAVNASQQQVAFDIWAFSHKYNDLATIADLARHTAGNVNFYPAFNASRNGARFVAELTRALTRPTGFEAVMRIRATKGIKVGAYHGHFFIRSSDLLALPNVDADQVVSVQLGVEDSLADLASKVQTVVIQAALLFTNSDGQRRIRVHTVAMPLSSQVANLYRHSDVYCMSNILCKMAIDKALSSKLGDARQALINKVTDIMLTYRQTYAAGQSSVLVMPESLKLLPLMVLAMLKSPMFRGGNVRLDERAAAHLFGKTMSTSDGALYFYPRLMLIHPLRQGLGLPDEGNKIAIPPAEGCTVAALGRDRILLLSNGQYLAMWIGREVPGEVLEMLFGEATLQGVDTTRLELPVLDNEFSVRVRAIVDHLRYERETPLAMYFIRDGDPLQGPFAHYMVEDRTQQVMDMYSFLVHLGRQKK